MKSLFKIIKKIKSLIVKPLSTDETLALKRKQDYEYLISCGVETQPGFVELIGKPIIKKFPDSRIVIGKGVTLVSESTYNVAGVNHPVILSTIAKGAEISISEGCGLSGSSIVSASKIEIGKYSLFGANTNVYDTDFHAVNSQARRVQQTVTEAESAPVIIGNDVWIGANSTVLKGVHIGNCAIVGAHSLVNKNVGENELHAGNPAKYIKKVE